MTHYKIVSPSMASCHGGNGVWEIGVERRLAPPLVPCRHGLHVCRVADLSSWLVEGLVLEVEVAGEIVVEADKIVVESATPIRVVGALTPRLLREFACDCAERALLREREAGREPDPRSWAAIEVARRFARGEATEAEMAAAYYAADAAAYYAAYAAYATAYAAYAAAAAAYAAAAYAAYAADAAYADAYADDAAERRWQGERILAMLEGR